MHSDPGLKVADAIAEKIFLQVSQSPAPFREIAILGPGLLGTSLALALRGMANVRLWGRRADLIEDLRRDAVAPICTTDQREAIENAELVVLCTPIETMSDLARRMMPFLKADAVVTDVGSMKMSVVQELESQLGPERFIGSHPMAGSEQSGSSAGRADLFLGAACILTPTPETSGLILQKVAAFWESLGCLVHQLSPAEHDRQVAFISHLPHLLAGCLVNTVAADSPESFALAGQGFRDSTRIASGPPEMWQGILQGNRVEVLQALRALQLQIQAAEELLESGQEEGLRNFLSAAKTRRDEIIPTVRYGGN